MTRFSIIIGVYNQKETLLKVVESLKQQTFRDFEVHFCDDGSTDGSGEILASVCEAFNESAYGRTFPGKRWYYHRQDNKGYRLGRSLNMGIAAAQGEYCFIFMADSFPEETYLETLDKYVMPHRLVCGIRIQIDNGQGVDVDYRLKKGLIPEENGVVLGRPWMALTGNGITYPRAAFAEYGGFKDLEGYGGEDNEMIARLFFKGYLCFSTTDLHLFHHWHKTRDTTPERVHGLHKMIQSYAS